MTERTPKRTRARWSTSPDVAKAASAAGSLTGAAASRRRWGVSEHRPYSPPRPATRKDDTR